MAFFKNANFSLSLSIKWADAIKLNTNYVNLSTLPQNRPRNMLPVGSAMTSIPSSRQCRQGAEYSSHVIAACSYNDLRRNNKHDKVKRAIRGLLEEKGFQCIDEARATYQHGSNRFIDILAFDPKVPKVYLIDPMNKITMSNRKYSLTKLLYTKDVYRTIKKDILNLAKESTKSFYSGARGCIGNQVMEFFSIT